MPRRFVWFSESGGPGKTTGAVHTSAAIGADGKDVALIDCDPQRGGATHHLGHGEHQTDTSGPTLTDVVFDGADPTSIRIETPYVDLYPSHSSLSEFDTQVATGPYRGMQEYLLFDELVDRLPDYDVVVFDAPATLSTLVDNALVAAQNIVVPIELTPKGKVSQHGLEDTIDAMNQGFDRPISVFSLVPSRVANATIFETIRDELEADGIPVSPFSIPEHSLLKYCWRERMDIFSFIESDDTRDLRDYERHVPQAMTVVGRLLSGQYDYDQALDIWDDWKDREMGDATPDLVEVDG